MRDGHDPGWVLDWYNQQESVRLIGMRAREVGERWGCATLDPPEGLRNPNGAVNGGVLSSFVDQTGGLTVAAAIATAQTAATIEIGIHFLRAAVKTPLTATGRVMRCGRTFWFLEIGVLDAEGVQCLNATGTWAVGRGATLPPRAEEA